MKIQNLAVIFVIIILPISIVLSTYTGKLISVVKAQSNYDQLLLNSTYDAIRAYQMNTLNDDYDQVANAKVRDINASINSFFNSLAAGMSWGGYTKRELIDYVPAMLYTLYDGYYVYSAYDNVAKVNGGTLTIDETNDVDNKQYGLKPFCYYSCTYSYGNNYNLVVNYTLDNYITVTGRYKDSNGVWKDVTASGYYIKTDNIILDEASKTVTITNDSDTIKIEPEKLGEYLITVDTRKADNTIVYELSYDENPGYYQYITYKNSRYYLDKYNVDKVGTDKEEAQQNISDSWDNIPIFYLNKGRRVYINNDTFNDLKSYIGSYDDNKIYSGEEFLDVNNYYYYYNAVKFSQTVYPALSKIDLGKNSNGIIANQDAKDEKDVDKLVSNTVIKTRNYHKKYTTNEGVESHVKTTYDTPKVFDTSGGNNPELESSSFNQHRMDVIISSIENSLMTAISNYSSYSKSTYDYMMPIIQEDEWDRICNNLTVVSFMQGLTVENYKYYSSYAVVANTKTKDFISRDSIYVQKNDITNDNAFEKYKNSTPDYHNPRCIDVNNNATANNLNTNDIIGYRTIDYMRQDVLLPERKIDNSTVSMPNRDAQTFYYYLQPGQAAYECNVGQNSNIYTIDELITGKLSNETKAKNNEKTTEDEKVKEPNKEVRRAYISALAREKGSRSNRYSYLNEKTN